MTSSWSKRKVGRSKFLKWWIMSQLSIMAPSKCYISYSYANWIPCTVASAYHAMHSSVIIQSRCWISNGLSNDMELVLSSITLQHPARARTTRPSPGSGDTQSAASWSSGAQEESSVSLMINLKLPPTTRQPGVCTASAFPLEAWAQWHRRHLS